MQIIAISGTHGKHRELKIPDGDILIHAGDITRGGKKEQVVDFLKWFSEQKHPHKIFIAGNHDFFFEQADPDEISSVIPDGIVYLNDSDIEINGFKF